MKLPIFLVVNLWRIWVFPIESTGSYRVCFFKRRQFQTEWHGTSLEGWKVVLTAWNGHMEGSPRRDDPFVQQNGPEEHIQDVVAIRISCVLLLKTDNTIFADIPTHPGESGLKLPMSMMELQC